MTLATRVAPYIAARPHGPAPAIEAKNLVKSYRGGVTALSGLTFSVEPGAVFGLLGPNGAGKSTAVRILATLSQPDSGSATVAGIDVAGEPELVRRAIGYVSQKAAVDAEATGRENLVLAGRLHGMRGASLTERVDDLLERFGIAGAADRVARTWSGGMQRKLDVAMGLVHSPRVLFLDEPTTGLDPEARAEMWDEIARLAGHEGLTVLLTTHYLDEADRLARRLAIVDRGRVVAEGTPEELKSGLRGDAVHVELGSAQDRERVLAALDRRDAGLREVTLVDRTLHARADNGAGAVPAVLAALDAAGIPVASVTVARPSLDDVYLSHAGRSFHTADSENAL